MVAHSCVSSSFKTRQKYAQTQKLPRVNCTDRFSVFVTKCQKVEVNEYVSHFYEVVEQSIFDTGAFALGIYAIAEPPPRYITGLNQLAEILIPGPFNASFAVASKVLELCARSLIQHTLSYTFF